MTTTAPTQTTTKATTTPTTITRRIYTQTLNLESNSIWCCAGFQRASQPLLIGPLSYWASQSPRSCSGEANPLSLRHASMPIQCRSSQHPLYMIMICLRCIGRQLANASANIYVWMRCWPFYIASMATWRVPIVWQQGPHYAPASHTHTIQQSTMAPIYIRRLSKTHAHLHGL